MNTKIWLVFTDNGKYEAPSLCSVHHTQLGATTEAIELQRQGHISIVEEWEEKNGRWEHVRIESS